MITSIATWENYQEKGQRSSFQSFGCLLSTHFILLLFYLTPDLLSYNNSFQLNKTSTAEPGLFQVCEVTATFKCTRIHRVKQVGKEQMLCSLSTFRWSLRLGSLWRCEQDSWLSRLSNTIHKRRQLRFLSGLKQVRRDHPTKQIIAGGGGTTNTC